jgi:hypothetical protein
VDSFLSLSETSSHSGNMFVVEVEVVQEMQSSAVAAQPRVCTNVVNHNWTGLAGATPH